MSGSFTHKIYYWINLLLSILHFIKIIGLMIFFLEQKRSYIPVKTSEYQLKGCKEGIALLGRSSTDISCSYWIWKILSIRHKKTNKICSWNLDLKFYSNRSSQHRKFKIFSSSSKTCISLLLLLTANSW